MDFDRCINQRGETLPYILVYVLHLSLHIHMHLKEIGKMNYYQDNNNIIIDKVRHFSLKHIFDCGQCFRFNLTDEGNYEGVVFGRVLRTSQQGDRVTIYDMSLNEFEERYTSFFALDEDYEHYKEILNTDEIISHAIEVGSGIRILKQDLFETIISFIISQNNNIPRIKKNIEALSKQFGKKLEYGSEIRYAFPTAEKLHQADIEDYSELKLGYRQEYIANCANDIVSGKLNLTELSLADTETARKMLLSVKGIGGKVADCILLFGLNRYEVCPHDVWVKRIFQTRYNLEKVSEKTGYDFASAKWGNCMGIAQQYLFYSERENL